MMMNMNGENRISGRELSVIWGGQGNINDIPASKYEVGDIVEVMGDLWSNNAEITEKEYENGHWWYCVKYERLLMKWADGEWDREDDIIRVVSHRIKVPVGVSTYDAV